MKQHTAPYTCHVFVCATARDSDRKSCGTVGKDSYKAEIKAALKPLGDKVRVSESSCMGLCEEGPNILIYPQQIWFSGVEHSDLPEIIQTVEALVENDVV